MRRLTGAVWPHRSPPGLWAWRARAGTPRCKPAPADPRDRPTLPLALPR